MTTKEFIQYAMNHKAIGEKISACTTPEDAFSIAKDEGLTDDKETFIAVMETACKEYRNLAEDDLHTVNAAGIETDLSIVMPNATETAGAATM